MMLTIEAARVAPYLIKTALGIEQREGEILFALYEGECDVARLAKVLNVANRFSRVGEVHVSNLRAKLGKDAILGGYRGWTLGPALRARISEVLNVEA